MAMVTTVTAIRQIPNSALRAGRGEARPGRFPVKLLDSVGDGKFE